MDPSPQNEPAFTNLFFHYNVFYTHRGSNLQSNSYILNNTEKWFYEVAMSFMLLLQTSKFSNYASIALTTTQPLLSASIPTEPIPLLRSSHQPAGKLAEHSPNAYTTQNCPYIVSNMQNYSKLTSMSKVIQLKRKLVSNNRHRTCRILKTAPGTTSNIGHTFMSAGDTNFLLLLYLPSPVSQDTHKNQHPHDS